MSYTASDFNLFDDFYEPDDLTEYTTDNSKTYTAGNFYVMFIGSGDLSSPAVPATIVTAGANPLVWTLIDSSIYDPGSTPALTNTAYWAEPALNTTSTTVITYDSQQTRCAVLIHEITKSSEVIQSSGNYEAVSGNNTITVNLPDTVATTSLVLSGFITYLSSTWTAGGGQTAIAPASGEVNFSQYNLGTYDVIPASTAVNTFSLSGIAVEIGEVGGTPEAVTEMYTLNLTDNGAVGGNAVIHETTAGFDAGVTVALWPADDVNNAETASAVVALSVDPTSTPQYNVTFSVAADNAAGDTVHFTYLSVADGGAGDMRSVTGGNALASGTFDGTNAMVCP